MILSMLIAAAGLTAATPPSLDVTVRFDAELLSTSTGREKVYDRLERKVARACAVRAPTLRAVRAKRACTADLLDQFVGQIDDPRLTALHDGRSRAAFADRR